MGNSAEVDLVSLPKEDDALQADLLVSALRLAIGVDGLPPAVEDESMMQDILLLALDEVSDSISAVVDTCSEIVEFSHKSTLDLEEAKRLQRSFASQLQYLSELHCALCEYRKINARSLNELNCGTSLLSIMSSSRHQSFMQNVRFWLREVEYAACQLEQELLDCAQDVGMAYLTNLPMIREDEISINSEEIGEYLRGYAENSVPVFAMTLDDFNEFVQEFFLAFSGGFDPATRSHVMYRTKLKAAVIEFGRIGCEDSADCVLLNPVIAKQLFKSCNSAEWRWLVDAPGLSSEMVDEIAAFAERAGWKEF